jgi:MSHA pilin protein MshA
MRSSKRNIQAQQGFTLIEIIAVLVILGILAATAAPKFVNLQDEARASAAKGAVSAAQSQLSMTFAQSVLNGTDPGSITGTSLSDICGNIAADGVNATCTSASGNGLNGTVTVYGCYGEGSCSSSDAEANATWTSPNKT